jgi:hypothetical protein
VTVTWNQPRTLSAVFGAGDVPVSARSVARGLWVPAGPQIIIFDLKQPASLAVANQGVGSITALGGPVIVNSDNPQAARNTTDTTSFTAPFFQITGGMDGNFVGPRVLGARPTPDPLSYLPPPGGLSVQKSSLTVYTDDPSTGYPVNLPPNPLPPGIYEGGIFVLGKVSLTLQPGGTYYIKGGGFFFLSLGSLTGNGVMIYNEPTGNSGNEQVYIDGNNYVDAKPPPPSSISLSPLTSGPYQGLTIFQTRTAPDQIVLNGNGNTNITGCIYAADANLTLQCEAYGGKSDVLGTQFMVRTMLAVGKSNLVFPQSPQPVMQRIIGLGE